MKKITIVTINLNMREDLERTIRSVVSQKCDRGEYQYIIVDGMSGDGSIDTIERYGDEIDTVIVERDNGIFDAMNKGISSAHGEYIYFLNAGDRFFDDFVLRDIIDIVSSQSKKHNIICGNVATYRSGKRLGMANVEPWIPHQGAFVKTELMKRYRFDDGYRIFGDMDLWRRMKNDAIFEYLKIDRTIAKMELDGVGSDPRYAPKRLRDKWRYAKKHGDYKNLIGTYILQYSGYIAYRLFGEDFYYHRFTRLSSMMKKMVRRPYWSTRRIIYSIYSISTYPIYRLLMRRYGLWSFIHPCSSIGNHNLLSIGRHVEINHNVTIWGDEIEIGDYVQLNPNVSIYGKVYLGRYVMVGPGCMIAGGHHSFDSAEIPMRFQGGESMGVRIDEDVWLGANCVVRDGIHIGKGAVIGAGSVVTGDIPPMSVCYGNPARVVRKRDTSKITRGES
jgi:acetyltransferase-like isoleucine patch superfamily enzyme